VCVLIKISNMGLCISTALTSHHPTPIDRTQYTAYAHKGPSIGSSDSAATKKKHHHHGELCVCVCIYIYNSILEHVSTRSK
jgi:hypothetical protein